MSNIVHLLFHSVEEAKESKKTFEGDYEMYVAYIGQFRETIDGEPTRIVPVSEYCYNTL